MKNWIGSWVKWFNFVSWEKILNCIARKQNIITNYYWLLNIMVLLGGYFPPMCRRDSVFDISPGSPPPPTDKVSAWFCFVSKPRHHCAGSFVRFWLVLSDPVCCILGLFWLVRVLRPAVYSTLMQSIIQHIKEEK